FVCMKSLDAATAASIDMLAKEFTKNIVCVPEINSVIYKILHILNAMVVAHIVSFPIMWCAVASL
ncbi:MAG: hypothetical protein IJY71_03845, partial [Clostridia bacterium]|nr:hypothetical protein [Clostridia bacterium]